MANTISGIRIICSIALLFCPVFSAVFYAFYITAGLSDMADGAIARKTGTVSELGSKLDTAADFALVAVCMIRLLSVIDIPIWLIVWIIVIAVIKAVGLIIGFIMRRELAALHTVMNKVTGVLLFILPMTLTVIDIKYSGAFICAAATFAAIQEGYLIKTGKIKNDNKKNTGLPLR